MRCEASIIVAVQQGEKELFHGLILPYEEIAFRLAFYILRDDADAEDVVQQACINAYRHLRMLPVGASFGTWLLSMVLHEAQCRQQQEKQVPPIAWTQTVDPTSF